MQQLAARYAAYYSGAIEKQYAGGSFTHQPPHGRDQRQTKTSRVQGAKRLHRKQLPITNTTHTKRKRPRDAHRR